MVAVPIGTEKSIRLRATMNAPEEALPPEYTEFVDVFSEEQAGILPENTAHDHTIDLKEGTQPPYKLLYPLSQEELHVLWNYIKEYL
jgi:hypothetical protein